MIFLSIVFSKLFDTFWISTEGLAFVPSSRDCFFVFETVHSLPVFSLIAI